jgi:hypothetical protein
MSDQQSDDAAKRLFEHKAPDITKMVLLDRDNELFELKEDIKEIKNIVNKIYEFQQKTASLTGIDLNKAVEVPREVSPSSKEATPSSEEATPSSKEAAPSTKEAELKYEIPAVSVEPAIKPTPKSLDQYEFTSQGKKCTKSILEAINKKYAKIGFSTKPNTPSHTSPKTSSTANHKQKIPSNAQSCSRPSEGINARKQKKRDNKRKSKISDDCSQNSSKSTISNKSKNKGKKSPEKSRR